MSSFLRILDYEMEDDEELKRLYMYNPIFHQMCRMLRDCPTDDHGHALVISVLKMVLKTNDELVDKLSSLMSRYQ